MSTDTTPKFNEGRLGQWSDPAVFAVTRERIQQYAEATNDTIAAHAAGDVAPPVFAIVPAFEALAPTMAEVIPPELIMMGVHGEQDFRFHKPIRPDTELTTRARAIGFTPKRSGVTVTVHGETHDQDGELVVEQYMMSFVRGAQADSGAGEEPPGHAFPAELRDREPLATVEQTFDADQTFRYSKASGDPMPIHLDDEVAKAMGLPGIIIHGLCTMAFTSRAVIETACPDDPTRLQRLAVRFAKIVQPEQTITTRIWDAGFGSYVFETTADSGVPVIKDGLAKIA